MNCPNCDSSTYQLAVACPTCYFNGPATLIEELWHIRWLLNQMKQWADWGIARNIGRYLEGIYLNRLVEVKTALGLQVLSADGASAKQAWPELIQHEHLLEQIAKWGETASLEINHLNPIIANIQRHTAQLRRRLMNHPRPDYPQTISDQLEIIALYREFVEEFTSVETQAKLLPTLLAEQHQLEAQIKTEADYLVEPEPVILDPIPTDIPLPKPNQPLADIPPVEATPVIPTSPLPAPKPKIPLRERLWQTVLSERTLHAMLVLGIFLIVSGAISFVIWGWENFSPPVRVAIPAVFTMLFFGMGGYVRTQTTLYRSGIALSALAALLIPIDFYTIYVNFNVPPDYRTPFWLMTSLICLVVYLMIALLSRSRLFGYLVAIALGSTTLALLEVAHEQIGVSLDWRGASLALLATALIITATRLSQVTPGDQWRFFVDPFRYLGLLTIAVLMPFMFGWRYVTRPNYDTLHYALTIIWWCGGFIFGWGAVFYRSRGLGILAGMALPISVYLGQAALFAQFNINQAWHGVGFASLVFLYLSIGSHLRKQTDDEIIYGHGRTALNWGYLLLLIATVWPISDSSAATVSHLIISGSLLLMALFWQQPRYLYSTSLFALTSITFLLSDFNFTIPQLSVGWSFIAILHLILALNLPTGYPMPLPDFATPLVRAGYLIAGVAIALPLFPYQGNLMIYTLGNWLVISAWGAYLAHQHQPGFVGFPTGSAKSIFHWCLAIPLPLWIWILFTNQRPPDFTLPLAWAVLAWIMLTVAYRLARLKLTYKYPWYIIGGFVSLAAPVFAFIIVPAGYTPAITLLLIGLLYFADAITGQQRNQLFVAGLVTAWGYALFWYRWGLSTSEIAFLVALLITSYLLIGLWVETHRQVSRLFLEPLHLMSHLLTACVLLEVYIHPFSAAQGGVPWTDEIRWWGVAIQFLLGVVYALYARHIYAELGAHFAVWVLAGGGAFLGMIFSSGRGSSTVKAALGALLFVAIERGLYWLWHHSKGTRPGRAWIQYSWRLYQRPLLVAGFTISVITIHLALIRNLFLNGTWSHKLWAMVGLWLIVGLYAASSYLFQRVRFVWFATLLAFIPWTIMTHLTIAPTLSQYALSWLGLAWGYYLLALGLERFVSSNYSYPLKTVTHNLVGFALIWGLFSVNTSKFGLVLAIGLYSLMAWLKHQHYQIHPTPSTTLYNIIPNPYLYPMLGLLPLAAVYWLRWLAPTAANEHYGLLLLIFAPLGLLSGQILEMIAPAFLRKRPLWYGLPAYLTGYLSLTIGILLVIQVPYIISLALLFSALICIISAWLFRKPIWVYPATLFVPLSLLIALNEAHIPFNRQGWWLIALGGCYFLLSSSLRRLQLQAYSIPTITIGFALIALGLPPSSQDKMGALWGFGAAMMIYGLAAFWLRQPLLLILASLLASIPYFMALELLGLPAQFWGAAFLPGILFSLIFGRLLDFYFESWQDFPWYQPHQWLQASQERLLNWWGLSPYLLGLSWTALIPLLTRNVAAYSTANALIAMLIFGWATYRFRLRGWLLAVAIMSHAAILFGIQWLEWWIYPDYVRLVALLTTTTTLLTALFIEHNNEEGSPLIASNFWWGWSRPIYLIALADILISQIISLPQATLMSTTVTIVHAILIGVLVMVWVAPGLAYLSLTLTMIALTQGLIYLESPLTRLPTSLAQLMFLYGLIGFGTVIIQPYLDASFKTPSWLTVWKQPLQRFSLFFATGTLLITGVVSQIMVPWALDLLSFTPYWRPIDFTIVWMTIGVCFWVGLLYFMAAVVYQSFRLGYSASSLLLLSWLIFVLFILQWVTLEHLHWYIIPVSLYIMAIATVEVHLGHKTIARWLDYGAIGLLLTTLFWQTLLFGWWAAFVLGGVGILMLWWGSARRLRRFLYAGMVGVILATLGQLINALDSVNQWMIFGLIGLILIVIVMVVERKMEQVKALRQVFDTWE